MVKRTKEVARWPCFVCFVEMASNLVEIASNLVAMASNLVAVASNLVAMPPT